MIASLRGIVALAVIAVALALAVALHRDPAAIDHMLWPGFTGDVHELRWQRAVGDLAIHRDGARWLMGTRTLDGHAIDAILSALRGARWHRRADRARAGAIHATLFVDGTPISIGQAIPGVDQVWLVVDERAELVDGWVARALEPQPIALVDRVPFAGAATAELRVSSPALELAGTPRRSQLGVVAPARVAALVHALEAIELVRLPTLPAAGTTITLGAAPGTPIIVGGACAHDSPLLALHAASGDGCIEPAAWQAVVDAASSLATADALDPRPAGFPIARLGELDLAKPTGLDPDAVSALLAALAQPGELIAPPSEHPARMIAITPKGGAAIELDVFAAAVQRRGEPRAIRVAPALLALLALPPRAFADPTRWAEDPASVTQLAVDGVTFTRGAALGEWTPKADPALLEALAEAVANVRAPDDTHAAPLRVAHRLAVTFAPPVGPAVRHQLVLGDDCRATIDGAAVIAPLRLCLAVAAVAR